MNNMNRWAWLWAIGMAVAMIRPAGALDVLSVAPKVYKLAFENERVRVLEGTFKPGDKIGMHSHPDHFVYVVKGGKLKLTKPDGSSSVVDVKPGQVLWINAESHAAENAGNSTVKLVVNELKDGSGGAAAAPGHQGHQH